MIIKKLDGDIFLYEDVIPENINILEEFKFLTDEYGKNFQLGSMNNKEYNLNIRSSQTISLHQNPNDTDECNKAKKRIDDKINKIVNPCMFDFLKKTGHMIKEKESWELLRYNQSEKVEWHVDNGPFHPCIVSFVIYLNDDYEGGEIEFRDFLIGRKLKPKSGSVLIFPSSNYYIHKVNPVKSGTKYSMTSFAK